MKDLFDKDFWTFAVAFAFVILFALCVLVVIK